MDINEIKTILLEGTLDDKIEILDYLCDIFESYNKNIDHFEELLKFLIHLAIETQDEYIKDDILETICKAAIYQNIDNINFDVFNQNMQKVSVKYLPRYIDILSYTHNKKYIESIFQFKNHQNKYVQIAVKEAAQEMGIEYLVW